MGRKRAICFGTNYTGTANQLTWCEKDARDWAAFFTKKGFEVVLILGTAVTRARILSELKKVVAEAKNGDIVVFAVTGSSHGTRSYSSSEPDFYNEALYLEDGIVLDDEIGAIVADIPEGFPNFIFFDSCHSGGAMRLYLDDTQDRIRYVEPDFVIPGAKPKKSLKGDVYGNEVYLAACNSDEYSYDAGALKNGAATYYVLNSYKEADTPELWETKFKRSLPSEEYPQSPHFECKPENKTKDPFKELVTTDIPDIPPTPTNPPLTDGAKKKLAHQTLVKIKKLLDKYFQDIKSSLEDD